MNIQHVANRCNAISFASTRFFYLDGADVGDTCFDAPPPKSQLLPSADGTTKVAGVSWSGLSKRKNGSTDRCVLTTVGRDVGVLAVSVFGNGPFGAASLLGWHPTKLNNAANDITFARCKAGDGVVRMDLIQLKKQFLPWAGRRRDAHGT